MRPDVPLVWGMHLDAICLHLEAVTRGDIRNLAITIPPGTTKSLTVSVFWPSWTWASSPRTGWLTAANEQELALRDAVACRRLLESDWYQDRWGSRVKMTSDQNVKGWYENTAGGFRNSVSAGGAITGRKGDILVADDLDDARKVVSEAYREANHEWWDQGFYNRVNDHKTGRRVVIGQRTHEEDCLGHVLKGGNFVELRIPEEFEPENRCRTPIWEDPRTTPGELLRPERFGRAEIEEAKKRLGDFGYSAQHQQRPTSKEGYRFRREWFRYYHWRGDYLVLGDSVFDWRNLLRFMTIDPAASAKTTADFTVASVWALTPRHDLVWLACLRVQKEIPDIVPAILSVWDRWKPRYAGIEAVASNNAVFKLAARTRIAAKPLDPAGEDKLVRATPAMVLMQTSRVWMPDATTAAAAGFPLTEVEGELASFTGIKGQDAHDDIVDTLSYAADESSKMPDQDGRRQAPRVYRS